MKPKNLLHCQVNIEIDILYFLEKKAQTEQNPWIINLSPALTTLPSFCARYKTSYHLILMLENIHQAIFRKIRLMSIIKFKGP